MRVRAWTGSLAAAVLLTGILSAQVTPVHQVVVATDPVELDVAVSRKGIAVSDLSREDISVFEDGQPQEIQDFKPVGMPYNLLFLVDRSGRNAESEWPEILVNSVDFFLKRLRGPDRLAVAAFDNRVAVLVDWRTSRNGTAQKVALPPSPQPTRFFDALEWATEEIATGPRKPGRRGVLVFSDGRDIDMYPKLLQSGGKTVPDPRYEVPLYAEARFTAALQKVAASGVPFYFVAVDTDRQLSPNASVSKLEGWTRFLESVRKQMEQVVETSGGTAVFPKETKDLIPLFERLQRDLGAGYHVTYRSQRPGDGKVRKIEVRARNSGLEIYQSHDSYYAR